MSSKILLILGLITLTITCGLYIRSSQSEENFLSHHKKEGENHSDN